MGFRLLIMTTGLRGEQGGIYLSDDWVRRLEDSVPGIEINVADTVEEAESLIPKADAAYGFVTPRVFERGTNLRWVACPQAGPPAGYYHQAMIDSDVVVTNTREIYNDHISAHIMSFVLAFARGLHVYIPQQLRGEWKHGHSSTYLPEATAVIVGVGGIGGETARVCSALGMTVLGVDPRREEAPEGVAELHRPEELDGVLLRGDFVIVTVPETPETQGLFTAARFKLMKPTAFFINIGRGATVVLDDLDSALRSGEIAGAALDVFEVEPLPEGHPLWTAPNFLMTPHVAADGPYLDERRIGLLVENCRRFNEGRPLENVVDKAMWF